MTDDEYTPGDVEADTPGYTDRVREIVNRAERRGFDQQFGYDVIQAMDWGYVSTEDVQYQTRDTVDVLNAREGIPCLCTVCQTTWLMGPAALSVGLCWHCRTAHPAARGSAA